MIYSKQKEIYTGWYHRFGSERLYGGKRHINTHNSHKRKNTRLHFLGKKNVILQLQHWKCANLLEVSLLTWSFFFIFCLDLLAFCGHWFPMDKCKDSSIKAGCKKSNVESSTASRWKILFGPSLVTTGQAVKTLTFHLQDWASNTVTVKIQHSLLVLVNNTDYEKNTCMPTALQTFVLNFCSQAKSTVRRTHGREGHKQIGSTEKHSKNHQRCSFFARLLLLLLLWQQDMQELWHKTKPPQCFLPICTQHTVCKYAAWTFTKP